MTHHHYCTYFDQRYLLKGRALSRSLSICVGDYSLWVLCFDDITLRFLESLHDPRIRAVPLVDLEAWAPQLLGAKPDRTRVEYYWTCTPTWLAYVGSQLPEDSWVTYLDADLYFFSDPAPIFEEAQDASVIIHGHRYSPRHQHWAATSGIYNVGLTAFRLDESGRKALSWWQAACLEACYMRPEDGYCGDQKYLDDWPTRFARVCVLQNVGAGVAPWNVDKYAIGHSENRLTVDGQPLVFYHFHAFQMLSSHITWQRGYDISTSVRNDIYMPYIRSLYQALAEVRAKLPGFRGAFQWPHRLEVLDEIRHGRYIWTA